jgi:uncharacterized integral membrane protein (TIGR00697 family)
MILYFNEILFLLHACAITGSTIIAASISLQALTGCIMLQIIFANFFILKQISLFNLIVTPTDVFIVSVTLGLGLMQTLYGEQEARKAITLNLYATLFYLMISMFHLAYLPAITDSSQIHYQTLLAFMPRIISASIAVSWAAEQFNRLFLRFALSLFSPTKATILSTGLSQTFDTLAFSTLGLYGLVPSIIDIIFVSLCIKYLLLIIASPMIHAAYRYLKEPHAQL